MRTRPQVPATPDDDVPYLEVHERFAGRMAIAVGFLLVFGALTQRAIADSDPAAGPIGLFAGLAATRLGWLAWRRRSARTLLTIAVDGLTVRGLGRIAWPDVAGLAVREERIRFSRAAFLDLCIRRPSRYDLPVSRSMPGRDGFAVRWVGIKWIDIEPGALDRVLRAARRHDPAPFAECWGPDMDASEIHAALDEDALLHTLQGEPQYTDADALPPEVAAALARAPEVLRAQTDAVARRSERRRRHARGLLVMLLVLLVLMTIARLMG